MGGCGLRVPEDLDAALLAIGVGIEDQRGLCSVLGGLGLILRPSIRDSLLVVIMGMDMGM